MVQRKVLVSFLGSLLAAAWAGHLAWHERSPMLLWGASLIFGSLAALGTKGPHSSLARGDTGRWDATDGWILAALLLVCAPIYFWWTSRLPYRINADEIIFVHVQRLIEKFRLRPLSLLPFFYFHPTFVFIAEAWLAKLFGSLSWVTMRLASATVGLATAGAAYVFFRQTLDRRLALCAAVIVALCHSLVVLSRMALWNNTALFLELVALTLLIAAWRRDSSLLAYAGGIAAGASFYTYATAKVIFLAWGLILVAYWRGLEPPERRRIYRHAGMLFFGAFVTAAPAVCAAARHGAMASYYSRRQFLIYPEGRAEQRRWMPVKGREITINIRKGLGVYNNRASDTANTYPNQFVRDTGFIDPLTGILLWIGVIAAALRKSDTQDPELERGLLAAFVMCWLGAAFVINKAPSYPRMLVTLPMVGYLAAQGLAWLARGLASSRRFPISEACLLILGVIGIAFWNADIFARVMIAGLDQGDSWGGAGRYLMDRRHLPRYHYFIIGDDRHRYFPREVPFWKPWMESFASPQQTVDVVRPEAAPGIRERPPFTVFLTRDLWAAVQPGLAARYRYHIYRVLPDGSRLAVEAETKRVR